GYKRNFVIYDDDDQTALVKKIMKESAIDPKRVSPAAILSAISRAKSELVGSEDFAVSDGGYFQNVAAKIYPIYQDTLSAANAFDFDDLIMKVVEVLRQNPDILEKYQDLYRYILVDEYQDTNFAQYILVKLLAQKYRNLCVVGDDWQCVYSWRNADFRNILNFEKDYPEAKVVKLEQNYRSTKNILDCAGAVIAENNFRTEKELWTKNPAGAKLKICSVFDEKKEGDFIAKEVARLMEAGAYAFKDFAVLYRTNAQSRALEESFLKAGTPYRIIGGVKFYSRKEIKDILAYLRLIANPNDLIGLQRIINVPPRGLGDFSPSSVDYLAEAEKISPRKFEAAKKFRGFIAKTRSLADKIPVSELIKIIIKETGYADWLDGGTVKEDARLENIKELASVARSYGDLNGFLEHAALISEADRADFKKDAVNLMTAHLAKGLEFPVVFIAGMEEGLLPHSRSLFGGQAAELEEERRLCYVGMTRAKENLYLLFARRRLGFSG
ncbi:MAG: 3'-5' exonuclease, partial [Patescibacteria group bacterium]